MAHHGSYSAPDGDIFSPAPEEAKRHMLNVLDTTRAQLIAGNLSAVVCVAKPRNEAQMLDGLICGDSAQITFLLAKMLFAILSLDAQTTHDKASEMLAALMSSPHRGQA